MTRLTDAPRNPRNEGNRTSRVFPRFRGFRGQWLVLGAFALLVGANPVGANHAADPEAPYDFRNSQASAFASITMPVYLDASADEPLALDVPVTLHPEALPTPAARYLVGFNLHNEVVHLDGVEVTYKGKPVAFERDVRSSALQPRLIIAGDDLPRTGPVDLRLTGTATPTEDGRIHVGALAIAFDSAWGTLHTRDGAAAQAYSFTLLMAQGHPGAGLAPRFHGEGNSVLALAPLVALLGLTVLGLRAAWRRVHPPAQQPTPTPTPAPAPARASAHAAQAPRPTAPLMRVAPAARGRAPDVTPFSPGPTSSGVPAFRPLLADPLATRHAPAPTPVAVVRRKSAAHLPVVMGTPLAVGRIVAVEAPLASAASSVVARPPRPSRARQAQARGSSFEVFETSGAQQ